MLLSEFIRANPVKAKLLKIAAGGRCEHCSGPFLPAALVIHIIDTETEIGPETPDLQKHLLVLCPDCRHRFLSAPVDVRLQKELVRYRPHAVKKEMRRILGSRTRTYYPPKERDPGEIYREMFETGSLDLCLNGG